MRHAPKSSYPPDELQKLCSNALHTNDTFRQDIYHDMSLAHVDDIPNLRE